MEYLSVKKIRELDKYAIETLGIPGIVLMENAAIRIFEEIVKQYGSVNSKKILIFCGKGNNGGDGFALARHLYNNGAKIMVFLLAVSSDLKGDAQINFNIINRMGLKVIKIKNKEEIRKIEYYINKADVIVDAILGTGFTGKLDAFYACTVSMINNSGAKKVSVDIPSGLNADSGSVESVAVMADLTVTLGRAKKGYSNPKAKKYLGKLKVVDISLPKII